MKMTRRPLGLEVLEDRWVPATIRFDGSNLFVSNPLVTAGASKISITETGANLFQVKDGTTNDGTYTAGQTHLEVVISWRLMATGYSNMDPFWRMPRRNPLISSTFEMRSP